MSSVYGTESIFSQQLDFTNLADTEVDRVSGGSDEREKWLRPEKST